MQTEWQQWREAVVRAEVDDGIGDLYARLDADIAARGPTCWSSGKCCKFDSYGHRLYVTGLEIARFSKRLGRGATAWPDALEGQAVRSSQESTRLKVFDPISHDACVFQVDGLCATHAIRPLGCRVFFCQQGTEEWQRGLYERYLDELRAMHDRWELPYRYMEWRAGLEEGERFLMHDAG